MAIKILIDENLSPTLCPLAHAAQLEAYAGVHHGMGTWDDHEIRVCLLENEWTIVSNNGDDFLELLGEQEIHPGLVIILPSVRGPLQRALFEAVLDYVADRDDLVNTILEVDLDDSSRTIYADPSLSGDERVARTLGVLQAVIHEYERPPLA